MLGNIREIFQNMVCIKFLPRFLLACKVFHCGFESMFCDREYKLIRNKNRWQAFLSFLWIARQAFLSFYGLHILTCLKWHLACSVKISADNILKYFSYFSQKIGIFTVHKQVDTILHELSSCIFCEK